MKQRMALSGTTAILLALTGAAQADVTGADVWNNWKAAAESVGQTLTPGSEVQDGDTLTVSDLGISMDMDEVTVSGAIAEVVFRDNGDGTVAISMSPSYDMTVAFESEDAEDGSVTLNVLQEGLAMTASGDPNAITYDFLATGMTVSVASLVVEDEAIELDANIGLSDLDGKYVVTSGDMTEVTTELNAGEMTIAVAMQEPGGGSGSFSMDLTYSELSAMSDGSLIAMADPEALMEALQAGMATASRLEHGAATFAVDFQDDADMFQLNGSAGSGLFDVSLDADALSYEVGNTALDVSMSGSEIPLPEVAFSMAEVGFSVLMPVAQSETPKDFGMGLVMDGLSVSDMIWGMIDAGGQLPHDPATLILEISGQANWLFDIFDPEAAATMDAEMPAELHAMDINELRLALAGAELTGSGGFTFDNNDLETFDGLPAPTGSVDLMLVGGNTLLDTLVAMGLVPEDQAMGARMMLGLFARPGDGEDTLVSKIEVDGATGAVSANGQRLQ